MASRSMAFTHIRTLTSSVRRPNATSYAGKSWTSGWASLATHRLPCCAFRSAEMGDYLRVVEKCIAFCNSMDIHILRVDTVSAPLCWMSTPTGNAWTICHCLACRGRTLQAIRRAAGLGI